MSDNTEITHTVCGCAGEGAGGCTDRVIKELSLRVQREFRIQLGDLWDKLEDLQEECDFYRNYVQMLKIYADERKYNEITDILNKTEQYLEEQRRIRQAVRCQNTDNTEE